MFHMVLQAMALSYNAIFAMSPFLEMKVTLKHRRHIYIYIYIYIFFFLNLIFYSINNMFC